MRLLNEDEQVDPVDAELTRMLQHHIDNHGTEATPQAMPDTSKPLGYTPPKDAEMEGLQANAKSARQDSRLGQSVADYASRPTNFLDYAQRLGGGGVSQGMKSPNLLAGASEDADKAITDLGEKRKADATAAANAEDSDPNSATASTYRSVLLKFAPDLAEKLKGANAKQMRAIAPWLEKFASENTDALKSQAAAKAKAEQQTKTDEEKAAALRLAQTHYEQSQANSDRNHRDSMGIAESNNAMARASLGLRQKADERDKKKDELEAAQKAKGHQTSTSTLTDLADAETAIQELGPLGQKFKDLEMSGPMAKVSGKLTDALDLQGTDAAEYKAAALRAMQGVGKIMEGGKLATSDEDKYRRMLPRAGDAPDIADQKIKESQAFLRKLKDERIKVLRAGGYDVPDVGGAGGEAKATPNAGQAPSPGPGFVRGMVNGKPGWINKAAGEWEPD